MVSGAVASVALVLLTYSRRLTLAIVNKTVNRCAGATNMLPVQTTARSSSAIVIYQPNVTAVYNKAVPSTHIPTSRPEIFYSNLWLSRIDVTWVSRSGDEQVVWASV